MNKGLKGTGLVLYNVPMLRMSKLTDYGALVLTCLARQPDAIVRASEVATSTHLAQPTVSKLLKMLATDGLVESFRGAHGGYRLARPAEQISLMAIIDSLEGPVSLTECATADGDCSQALTCSARPNWMGINAVIRNALLEVSLADLAQPVVGAESNGIAVGIPLRIGDAG